MEHLELLWAAGLNRSAIVRTTSPGLARGLDLPVDRLGEEFSTDTILQVLDTFDTLSQSVFKQLSVIHTAELALAVAKATWSCQRIVYDALLLRREDDDRPVCIPKMIGTTKPLTNVLTFRWQELRHGESAVMSPKIEVDSEKLPYVQPPVAGFWRRLRLADLGQITFRLQVIAAEKLSFLPWQGTIFCHRDPDLLKDAGISLMRRGLQLKPIRDPRPKELTKSDTDEASRIVDEIEPLLKSCLSASLDERNQRRCLSIIRRDTEESAARFLAARRTVDDFMQNGLPHNSGLASSTIASSEAIALAEGFRKRALPIFTFSHGATRRISQHHDRNPILHETMISDVHFTFAPEDEEGDVPNANSVAVGMPTFYRRKPLLSRLRRPKGIWYISSGLYMGGGDKLHRAMSDHTQCAFEEQIVTDVLAHTPHPIVYKPYPAFRYLDADPILTAARNAGLTVHESGTDLRYEIHKPELLIVSRSGSTIGYCLCQDKPMVYIEAPGRKLREEAAFDFEQGIFLFSAYDSDFLEKLRDFLSLPMKEIRARWKAKQTAREQLINRHISEPISNGSARIARRMESSLVKSLIPANRTDAEVTKS